MVTYSYLGHSCFLLDDGKYKVLVDPYLTGNPAASRQADEVDCDFILLSHAHSDHIGDAASIAARTGAAVIGVPEVLALCPGAATQSMNLGGSKTMPFGKIRMVPALHSSGAAGGIACGYVIYIGGTTVYYAGDTALFSDMKLIGQKDELDYAVLPIGDNFTMGLEDAALAAQWLNVKHVIPVHYNTWPVIAQDVQQYKNVTEAMTKAKVHIVKPGEELQL
jgi:L-ascorbate metabolism protein UlaG (beta-lactamase superfamily)